MKCAGSANDPLGCGEEAIMIISGFSQCLKHAREVATAFKLMKMKMQQNKMQKYYDKDLVPGKGLDLSNQYPAERSGVWKNIKNTT